MVKSKITGGDTKYLFSASVLNKYPVKYYQCLASGFIQTEEPFWLQEAYTSPITSLDIGLLMRNQKLADATEKIIGENFDPAGSFLDYAGGYGTFTRLMRDKGYDFYHLDKYCENLFAKHFTHTDRNSNAPYELATAFEVFEHFSDPLTDIREILKFSDTVFFSTELVPGKTFTAADEWWYFSPETGQHVSFFTVEALQHIARSFNLHFYTNQHNLHVLSARQLSAQLFAELREPFANVPLRKWRPAKSKDPSLFNSARMLFKKVKRRVLEGISGKMIDERPSLLANDYNHVKDLVRKGQA